MAPPEKKTEGDLAQAIGNAVKDAIRHSRGDRAGLSPAAIERLEAAPTPLRWRKISCRSEETGATFTAIVVESRTFPAGRITGMEDYKHPKGAYLFQDAGGLVPNGMQILKAGAASPTVDGNTLPKQDFEIHYLQWRWVEFWQRDLARYNGKELKRSLAIDDAWFNVPWQDGHLREEVA